MEEVKSYLRSTFVVKCSCDNDRRSHFRGGEKEGEREVMQKYRKLKTRNTLCIFVDTNLGLGSSRPEEEKEATCIFTVNMIIAMIIKAW